MLLDLIVMTLACIGCAAVLATGAVVISAIRMTSRISRDVRERFSHERVGGLVAWHDAEEEAAFRALLLAISRGAVKNYRVWYYDPTQKTFMYVVDDGARRTLRSCAKAFGGSVHVARYDRDLEEFVRETITAETPLEEIVV